MSEEEIPVRATVQGDLLDRELNTMFIKRLFDSHEQTPPEDPSPAPKLMILVTVSTPV
jgi:hypothetical protein